MSDENRHVFGGPPPKVHCTWIKVRGASPIDPGEIALVHHIVDRSVVLLTDEQGHPLKNENGAAVRAGIGPEEDAAVLARRLARQELRRDQMRRERPLLYEKVSIV